jgi:hypothetical protein
VRDERSTITVGENLDADDAVALELVAGGVPMSALVLELHSALDPGRTIAVEHMLAGFERRLDEAHAESSHRQSGLRVDDGAGDSGGARHHEAHVCGRFVERLLDAHTTGREHFQ